VWTGGPAEKIIPAPYGTKDTDVWLQIRVWDGIYGATYEEARAVVGFAYWSVSQPFLYHVPADGSAAGAYAMENLRAFGTVAPEPGIFTLAVLGLLSMGMARRRK
jgi:hypothetical protein